MKSRARQLRRDMTQAERRLWYHLRNRRLAGFRFRRQHPIGGYIVDFVCMEMRLVVEADGGQHSDQRMRDRARTRALEASGYRVIRFWNDEILRDTEAVLAEVYRVLCERER